MKKSFYWHDYETFGIIPGKDRASQFAGIRTDEDLNIIADPQVFYCQPADDFLPQPEACLVTGITPQHALEHGVPEYQFFKQIHEQLSLANTCTVGYNNIRFDDEFTRFGFYRNFYDPYAREWQNGNSRWDLIDMIRMTAALRPDGINWPINEKNRISFRLEKLTQANNISHQDAHDALSDVHATIAMAKLIKTKQPKLYDFCLKLRNKHKVTDIIKLTNPTPFLHVSGMYAAEHGHCALVLPIMAHPSNKNGIIVYDLRYPIDNLLNFSSEQIKQCLYTKSEELKQLGLERIALKTIHINKCPSIAPISTLSEEAQERLNIDINQQKELGAELLNILTSRQEKYNLLIQKLNDVYTEDRQNNSVKHDVDHALYSGGFFDNRDKDKMNKIVNTSENNIINLNYSFNDPRLDELLFRYKARNFKHLLSSTDLARWNSYRIKRMTDKDENASITFDEFQLKIRQMLENETEQKNIEVLNDLNAYASQLVI